YGTGLQTRDFTYIENVVKGNLLASQAAGACGEIINLATGGQISLIELLDKLNILLGKNIRPTFAPPRIGDVLHSKASIAKAYELLQYKPTFSFDEGLARLVDWFISEKQSP